MDIADLAEQYQSMDLDHALHNFRAAHPAPGPERPTHCKDCDEPIPVARRVAVLGATRCVECQVRADRKAELFGRPHAPLIDED